MNQFDIGGMCSDFLWTTFHRLVFEIPAYGTSGVSTEDGFTSVAFAFRVEYLVEVIWVWLIYVFLRFGLVLRLI